MNSTTRSPCSTSCSRLCRRNRTRDDRTCRGRHDTAGCLSPLARTPTGSATNAPSPDCVELRPRLERQTTTTSPQSIRRPSSQQCAVAHRHHTPLLRPRDTPLPPAALRRRQNQSRSHPLPQALRRTRALRMPPHRNACLTTPRSINLSCRAEPFPDADSGPSARVTWPGSAHHDEGVFSEEVKYDELRDRISFTLRAGPGA